MSANAFETRHDLQTARFFNPAVGSNGDALTSCTPLDQAVESCQAVVPRCPGCNLRWKESVQTPQRPESFNLIVNPSSAEPKQCNT